MSDNQKKMTTEDLIQKFIDEEKEIKVSPFLATRIMSKIENYNQKHISLLQHLIIAASFIFIISLGINFFSMYFQTNDNSNAVVVDDYEIENFAYLNLLDYE